MVASLCVHSIVSVGCREWDYGSQSLSFPCATIPLLPWAKSSLGRVGETGDIVPITYLTSFAQNHLLTISCTSSPVFCKARWLTTSPLLLTVLGEARQPVSTLALLLQIPLCCWGRCTAPQAEALPLSGPSEQGGRLVVGGLEWKAAVVTGGSMDSEEWKFRKKETNTIFYYVLNIFWGWKSWVFSSSSLTPSIQPGVKLSGWKRYCTARAGEAYPTGAMLGMKIGDVPVMADSYLREVGIFLCISVPPGCKHKSLL